MSIDENFTGKTRKRLVVLISGNGTNLQAIISASKNNIINADVISVISNKKNAFGLIRAKENNISSIYFPYDKNTSRDEYDSKLAEAVKSNNPDFIILAGWMRILSNSFLKHFPNKVINIHPALPGKYPGTDAIKRAYDDFKNKIVTETGIMVHYVPDEGVDDGPLIMKQTVIINPEDTLNTLEDRMHEIEHKLIVETIKMLCDQ